ncbi:DUF6300 family protein [Streptomyces spiramyceticus]|uniref:DUF6300 family protein n=1 Tax=Streptomyces spiramyceticus TaxID=299717 RepID=UPI00237B6426|nr:DUF6300 family protein [Streptomyces spiramyceticus]
MSVQEEEIVLQLADPPNCPPCGGPGLLLAQFPHSWKNARGEDVNGLREAVLCPACDCGEPAADELLALFAVDDQVGLSNFEVFGELVAAWVQSVRHRIVDEEALGAEYEQWKRGEL